MTDLIERYEALGFKNRVDFEVAVHIDGVPVLSAWLSELQQPNEAALAGADVISVRRSKLVAAVEAYAATKRADVIGTSEAAKLAVYEQKYEMARRSSDASPFAAEAAARGVSAEALREIVLERGDAWRAAGLAIDAAAAVHKMAIATTPPAELNAYSIEAGWP